MNVLASSSTGPLPLGLRRTGQRLMEMRDISAVPARLSITSRPVQASKTFLSGARSRGVSTLSIDAIPSRAAEGYRIPKVSSSFFISPLNYSGALPFRRTISTSTSSLLSSTTFTRLSKPTTTKPHVRPSSSSISRSRSNFNPEPEPEPEPGAEPEPETEPSEEPNAPPQSAMARLKLLFKRYGWYALGMYTVLSALDFSLTFALIHLVGLERMEPLIRAGIQQYRVLRFGTDQAREMKLEDERKRLEEKKEEKIQGGKKEKSGWISKTVLAEMALAYPIHKVALLPVRAGLTVAWTPKFVGWLTRRGWVGKGGYTRAATHAQDKIRTAKERVKERVKDIRE